MSKFPHDDFAKAYLMELLNTIGKATPNRPFKAETLFAYLPKTRDTLDQLVLGLKSIQTKPICHQYYPHK
jgi:hypothetical protein